MTTPDDVADLGKAWTHAGTTAGAAATQLHHITATQLDNPVNALTPWNAPSDPLTPRMVTPGRQ